MSGRPAAFLRDALAIDGLDYAGTYGLERIVAGEVVVDERVRPFVDAMAQAADEAEAALPGLLVERKGEVAVTIHWRDQPERGRRGGRRGRPRRRRASASRRRCAAAWRWSCGRRCRSTRAPRSPTWRAAATVAAFAGDDAGDLPAFDGPAHARRRRATLAHAVSIGVTSDESPPEIHAADVVVDGPAGLAVAARRRSPTRSARAWLSSSSSQVRGVCTAASSRRRVAHAGALVVGHDRARCGARARPVRCRTGARRSDRVVQLLVRARFG